MALTKIGSIGINTGIAFAGVTTIATLNGSDSVLSVGGTVNFVSDVSIGGTVSIAGTLTYEDVTNVDAVGLITARDGIKFGSGVTLSVDGDIFATGVVTATSFSGSGALLTGVASTENIRTNTNATFLQNINVSGTVTATSYAGSGANLTNLPAANLTGTAAAINGSNITNLTAANLTGALPAISGANLTGVDASQIVKWSYSVSSTGYSISNTGSFTDFTAWTVNITPESTSNRIMLICGTHLESRFSGQGGSGTVMQWMVSTDGGSSYNAADNGNAAARGWNNLSNQRVGTFTTLMGIHVPQNTNNHRFRLRGRTGGYTNTESWFGNSCDSSWWGSGIAIRTWLYAIELKPDV